VVTLGSCNSLIFKVSLNFQSHLGSQFPMTYARILQFSSPIDWEAGDLWSKCHLQQSIWMNSLILKIFSNLNDSMILLFYHSTKQSFKRNCEWQTGSEQAYGDSLFFQSKCISFCWFLTLCISLPRQLLKCNSLLLLRNFRQFTIAFFSADPEPGRTHLCL